MASRLLGPTDWNLDIDVEGHRDYHITFLIESDVSDGPTVVANTPGLFAVGALWKLGNDFDPWVWCRPTMKVHPHQAFGPEPKFLWHVEQTFSNKPHKTWCADTKIEDPVLQPPKISVHFTKKQEEATRDRYGMPILNSALEQIRGPTVEFDVYSPIIKIERNVYFFNGPVVFSMVNTLNRYPIWGFPPRTVKFSGLDVEEKFYGVCYKYYHVKLEFEVDLSHNPLRAGQSTAAGGGRGNAAGRQSGGGHANVTKGFDRILMDEGTRVLNGHWDQSTGEWILDPINGALPDMFNPAHFIKAQDRNGNAIRVILDGYGRPVQGSNSVVQGSGLGSVQVVTEGVDYDPGYPPTIIISGGGGEGAAVVAQVGANGNLGAAIINEAGSGFNTTPLATVPGYKVGDILTIPSGQVRTLAGLGAVTLVANNGTDGDPALAKLKVEAIDLNGRVTRLSLVYGGSYTGNMVGATYRTSGGQGSGCTVLPQWRAVNINGVAGQQVQRVSLAKLLPPRDGLIANTNPGGGSGATLVALLGEPSLGCDQCPVELAPGISGIPNDPNDTGYRSLTRVAEGTGTPRFWRISGFTGRYAIYNQNLKYLGNCVWMAKFQQGSGNPPPTYYMFLSFYDRLVPGGVFARWLNRNANGQEVIFRNAPFQVPQDPPPIPDIGYWLIRTGVPALAGSLDLIAFGIANANNSPTIGVIQPLLDAPIQANETVWMGLGQFWLCAGPNLMTPQAGPQLAQLEQGQLAGDRPPILTLSTGGKSEPGQITVEKYDDSDFLYLNVPIVL